MQKQYIGYLSSFLILIYKSFLLIQKTYSPKDTEVFLAQSPAMILIDDNFS